MDFLFGVACFALLIVLLIAGATVFGALFFSSDLLSQAIIAAVIAAWGLWVWRQFKKA
ncbi:MAG: hypothetical protein LBH13_06635 [Cellulomonadaceae bacterium]|jgi:hypothetical protein|nr:hypothetical protein [Cellulomonadaceae bacterium]